MLYADDAPEKRRVTEVFFEWLEVCAHELFVFAVVAEEIGRAAEPKRTRMRRALERVRVRTLPTTPEARRIARVYVEARIVPARFRNDAAHVAVAVWHRMDVVVSWNMEHLVKVSRIERFNQVNALLVLPPIRIHTPEEVIDL